MTTQADVNKLLKPLVAGRSDLFLHKRWLLFKPIRFALMGLFFERGSQTEAHYLMVYTEPLFSLRGKDPGGSEKRPLTRQPTKRWWEIYPEDAKFRSEDEMNGWVHEYWATTDSDYPQALLAAIEDEYLPEVAAISDMKALFEYEANERWQRDIITTEFRIIECAIACGRFGEAARRLDPNWLGFMVRTYNDWLPGLGYRLLEKGDGLAMEDKRALLAYLHMRESAGMLTIGFDKYWIPTPFPAEEQGLV